jgi:hypothetical protein
MGAYPDQCLSAPFTAPTNSKVYPHYFKPLPKDVTHVDVYWVIEAWGITQPALQHALKKIMCAGARGAKDKRKDIQEAIASCKRCLEMWDEQEN